jgi:hypothetical protein
MPCYAQVDANGRVVGVSDLSGEVTESDMIPIEGFNVGLMGKFYDPVSQEFELFDKYKLVLSTPEPYAIGTVNLVFAQMDDNNEPVVIPTTFRVDINGQVQDILVDDGTLEVDIDCHEPTTAIITISGYRHQSLTQEVAIGV